MVAIHIAEPALTIRAGSRALKHIRDTGLQPTDIYLIPGAAGGPKALGIQGLDIALFGHWLPQTAQPRSLIGASIGSWRFASVCMPDPVAGLQRLGELYTTQRFPKGISVAEISLRCARMLDELLDGQDAQILNSALYHLHIMVVKSLGSLQHDHPRQLGLGLGGVMGSNLLGRRHLKRWFERVIIHDQRLRPPLAELDDFITSYVPLSMDNLRPALLASGSIPMVMEAVRDIPGASQGVYRDGGLLDYHLDLPWRAPGVVLYPHFIDRVVPGWFDKALPWRKANPTQIGDVLLLAPSPGYLARLPYGKLPDRRDYRRFINDDAGRERYWRRAMSESQRMGDEFLELVSKGTLQQRVQPM
ncbi:MAG: patatin-like phospholipase family protein [Pseudomonas sp.]